MIEGVATWANGCVLLISDELIRILELDNNYTCTQQIVTTPKIV